MDYRAYLMLTTWTILAYTDAISFLQPPSSYTTITIAETVAPNEVIYTLVTDDIAPMFSITNQVPDYKFRLRDNTILMYFQIDFETEATAYYIDISAASGSDGSIATTVLEVKVQDVNEAPEFSGTYTGQMNENEMAGTAIPAVYGITDPEGDAITYSLLDAFFFIDRNTGQIFTGMMFDYEAGQTSFTFTVDAIDAQSNINSQTFTITINDVNDNAPVFTSSNYQTSISENTAAGQTVIQVTASDADVTSTVAITMQSVNAMFTMSSDVILTTSTPLDYDTLSGSGYKYTLVIVASDGLNSGTTTVTVIINPVNEHTPAWTSFTPAYVDATTPYTVSENDASGTTILTIAATDSDDGTDGQITYSLTNPVVSNTGDSVSGLFQVDSTTGVLRTLSTLDRDTATGGYEYYDVTITAADQGTSPLFVTRVVRVSVSDYNDQSPVCSQAPFTTSINENVANDYAVVTIVATDADEVAPNNALTYSVTGGNGSSFFVSDPNTGAITTSGTIDYEAAQIYQIEITVLDGGSPILSATCSAQIAIGDMNDNTPAFTTTNPLTVHISESASTGTTVTTAIAATDADSSTNNNNQIVYSFSVSSTYFGIDSSSGIVTVTGGLDRELLSSHSLIVYAVDQGSPQNTGSMSLTVSINDENDNSPTFSQTSYTFSISESASTSTSVGNVIATDTDTGVNAQITYVINSFTTGDNTHFGLHSTTGAITTAALLDRETADTYEIIVNAVDLGSTPLTGTATVTISITDYNDETPAFNSASYSASISENGVIGTSIITVTTTDNDIGVNDDIVLSIDTGTVAGARADVCIDVDSATSLLSVKQIIDRETDSSFNFTLIATDQGVPALSSSVNVVVTVADINDNSPVFSSNPLTVSVSESASNGAIVTAAITATDVDSSTNNNNQILYSFSVSSPHFNIGNSNSIVTVASGLDRETLDRHSLIVFAVDQGSPQNTGSMSLTVSITDENDNSPAFSQTSYTLSISESASTSTSLGNVVATDADDGVNAQITYVINSFTTGDNTHFSLDPTTGAITTAALLDRETADTYEIIVNAVDSGSSPLTGTATVTISITDYNDETPAFNSASYSASISENGVIGTSIITVTTTDNDIGVNDDIVLSIDTGTVAGARADLFIDVDSATSLLYVKQIIDRETDSSFNFTLIATDQGMPALSSSVNVVVTVADINDNSPVFSSNPLTVSVSESASNGAIVTAAITATDVDSSTNNNNQILYSFSVSSPHFNIGNSNSIVTVASGLDRETLDRHSLIVFAVDQGSPQNTGSMSLTVSITDENDNSPAFSQTSYTFSISESASTSTSLGNVVATDADTGVNAQITYVINSFTTGDNTHFSLNPTTGAITTAALLDRETADTYEIIVNAVDLGSTPLTGTATVTISITDYNDETPAFNSASYSASISENGVIGTSIITVTTTDNDIGVNDDIVLSIDTGTVAGARADLFIDVDSATSLLSVKQIIDRETDSSFNFTLIATDQGVPALSSSVNVVVTVTDINDNTPTFSPMLYSFNISESVSLGTSVGGVTATDLDDGPNAVLTYTVDSFLIGDSTHFTVNSSSGLISTSASLDRENTGTYEMKLAAIDNAGSPLTGTMTVTIFINDENDNSPSFSVPFYEGSVTENDSIGTSILTVTLTDADYGVNADVVLSIDASTTEGVNAVSFIDVNTTTSVVSVKVPIDRETDAFFIFNLVAIDQGYPALSSSASINITINDVNDNQPVFSPIFYNTEIAYNDDCQVTITTLSATDADSGSNADVSFAMSRAYNSSLFSLSTTTGELTLLKTATTDTTYILYAMATDGGGPLLNSTTEAIVRTDTYDPNNVILNYHMDIACSSYLVNETTFLSQLTDVFNDTYPTCYARRWCFVVGSSDSTCIVRAYVIVNDTADEVTELANTKYFLSADDALTITSADTSGTPASVITGAEWSQFAISKVEKYAPSDITQDSGEGATPWIETPVGIAVTSVLAVLGALGLTATFARIFSVSFSTPNNGLLPKKAPSFLGDNYAVSETSMNSKSSSASTTRSLPRVSIDEEFSDNNNPFRAEDSEPRWDSAAERASELEPKTTESEPRIIEVEPATSE